MLIIKVDMEAKITSGVKISMENLVVMLMGKISTENQLILMEKEILIVNMEARSSTVRTSTVSSMRMVKMRTVKI